MFTLRGLEEIKKFQKSNKNLEVGGWVYGQLGLKKKIGKSKKIKVPSSRDAF